MLRSDFHCATQPCKKSTRGQADPSSKFKYVLKKTGGYKFENHNEVSDKFCHSIKEGQVCVKRSSGSITPLVRVGSFLILTLVLG